MCYSPAGRSILGETVPKVLSTALGRTQTEGTEFLPIRTDLDWWITFLFFSYWDLKVSAKFSFTLHSAMCDEVGHVSVDEVRDIFQNKTLQHDF